MMHITTQPGAKQHLLGRHANDSQVQTNAAAALQLLAYDIFDGLCWQQALCAQRRFVWCGANEDHGRQALDLHSSSSRRQPRHQQQQVSGTSQRWSQPRRGASCTPQLLPAMSVTERPTQA